MIFYLFLLFIVLPLAEIVILVQIGQATVWWVPIAIVIVTGIAGTALARWQGWKVLDRIRDDVRDGRVPADSLIDGFLVLAAGILFVLPGVLTDVLAIVLLISPTRSLIKRGVIAWIKKHVQLRVSRVNAGFWPDSNHPSQFEHDEIIGAKVLGSRVEDASETRS